MTEPTHDELAKLFTEETGFDVDELLAYDMLVHWDQGTLMRDNVIEAAAELRRLSDENAALRADWHQEHTKNDELMKEIELVDAAQQPLTDEQIISIATEARAAEANKDGGYILPISFARAIERAHNIGSKT